MIYPIRTISSFRNLKEDHLAIGPTPIEEECVQAGDEFTRDKRECRIYIEQLTRQFGPPPDGCSYFILENHHEYGRYYEAAVQFDTENEKAVDYAFQVEMGATSWDEEAKQALTVDLPF